MKKIMSDPQSKPFKTLVVGPPRGGFTLLISVLNTFRRDLIFYVDNVNEMLNGFMPIASAYVNRLIFSFFEKHISSEELFYSGEFQPLTGGPKWLGEDGSARVRKYLGVKDLGDFTFILRLPRFVLQCDDVIHSHEHPRKWVEQQCWEDYLKLASIRNPIDIIHSSVYSINALASEYMERLGMGNRHDIRRELAMNKLSDPNLLEGLVAYLKRYLDEFIPVADKFDHVMKWEDLIGEPEKTIIEIGKSVGLEVTEKFAAKTWRQLGHRNLQRFHKHNFRKGKKDDWKSSITNTHLEIFKSHGFDRYLQKLGYGKIEFFKEKNYTPTQKKLEEHLKKGKIYEFRGDSDLYTFAFNKTNFIPSASTRFKTRSEKGGIRIERAVFKDEKILAGFLETVGPSISLVGNFLAELREALVRYDSGKSQGWKSLEIKYMEKFHRQVRSGQMPEFGRVLGHMEKIGRTRKPPILVQSHKKYNIVKMGKSFYGVPKSLGRIELDSVDVDSNPKILKSENLASLEAEMDRIASKPFGFLRKGVKWIDIRLLNR